MTDKTKSIIRELIGLKLTHTTRAANMECLKFGVKTNIENQNIGEFGLHIQTDSRIINEQNILVGSNDLYEPNLENEAESDFDYETGNLRDEKLEKIINSNHLIVTEICTDRIGGLYIQFKNKFELQVIPTNSSESEYNEFSRLIDNRKPETEHIVSRISGIDIE